MFLGWKSGAESKSTHAAAEVIESWKVGCRTSGDRLVSTCNGCDAIARVRRVVSSCNGAERSAWHDRISIWSSLSECYSIVIHRFRPGQPLHPTTCSTGHHLQRWSNEASRADVLRKRTSYRHSPWSGAAIGSATGPNWIRIQPERTEAHWGTWWLTKLRRVFVSGSSRLIFQA